jgi:hypothetical protein
VKHRINDGKQCSFLTFYGKYEKLVVVPQLLQKTTPKPFGLGVGSGAVGAV